MAVRPTAAVVVGAALMLLLSACAADVDDDDASSAPSYDGDTEMEVEAAWLDSGRMIALVTQGSSTCVPVVEEVGLQDNGTLGVILADSEPDQVCTMDYVPRVTLVDPPETVDPAQDLEIAISGDGYYGDTDLDGVPGLVRPADPTDYAPSAGWADDETIVLLTWGSSSCPPVVASVGVAGAIVTVTFEEPAADQVCTADMAPRATIVLADVVDDDIASELELVGAGFTGTRVAILGES